MKLKSGEPNATKKKMYGLSNCLIKMFICHCIDKVSQWFTDYNIKNRLKLMQQQNYSI